MLLSKTLTPFLYTFYLLGNSPFPTATSAKKTYLKKFLFKLPVLCQISFSLFVTVHFLRNDYDVAWENRGLDVIHVLLIMISLITNLIIAYQCLFRFKSWIQLQEFFGRLDTEFISFLPNNSVNLNKFRNNFLIKCFIMLTSYLVLLLAIIMSQLTGANYHTSYMIVLAFINDLCAFQVMFYVDLSKFFLKTIVHSLRDINDGNVKCVNETESKFLAQTKKLHANICRTVNKINEYFGPFLLSFIVQQFLVISYYVFWILLNKFSFSPWSSLDNASVLMCALLSLFFVTNSCHKVHIQSQKIGSFLHDDDNWVQAESQRFLSQVINQPIKISALEFYKLDRSFFAALTVGGITSAVMLVQFQKE